MIYIKTKQEIKKIADGGKILSAILNNVAKKIKPGITTLALNDYAEFLIKKFGATPSFKNFEKYPASLCTSVNDAIVHAIPSNYKLQEGDIIGLDLGIWWKGLCTDMARTVPVGKISQEAKKLISVTKKCLELGIKQIKPGNRIGDYGYAVQVYAEKNGFSVVRNLTGHGVGREVHEDPKIFNFGKPNDGEEFKEGMVIALEPMINQGTYKNKISDDGWTILTADKKLSAHFEHTVVVTKRGCKVLTK